MKLTSIITISCLLLSLTLTSCGQKGQKSALTDGVPKQTESTADAKEQTKAPEAASETVPVPASEATEEPERVTPTCMFFTSKKDTDHDKIMNDIEELKKKYDGKIKFDLIDVDENPEARENYSIGDQTPALIMLNIYNDISAFQYKVKDKEQIENAIKGGLGE